jgi:hypothetical protein
VAAFAITALFLVAIGAEAAMQTCVYREYGVSFSWDDADWTLSEVRTPVGPAVNLLPVGGGEGVAVLNMLGKRSAPGLSPSVLFGRDLPALRAGFGAISDLVESTADIGGSKAHIAEFAAGGQRVLRYTIVSGRDVVLAVLIAPAAAFDPLREPFRKVVESIRISPRPQGADQGLSVHSFPRKPYLLIVGDTQMLLAECMLSAPAGVSVLVSSATVVYRDKVGGLLGVASFDAADLAQQWRVFTASGERTKPSNQLPAGAVAVFFLPMRAFPIRPQIASVEATFVGAKADGTPVAGSAAIRPLPFQTAISYRLPVEGKWTVLNGPTGDVPHRTAIGLPPDGGLWLSQRYALDLLFTAEDGLPYRGDGADNEQYYCFGMPVYAPAAGTVLRAENGVEDNLPGRANPDQLLGNYVVIEHAEGEYSLLAHLKKGSLLVNVGEKVKRGQIVGQVGNSGNSTGPHLHYQLQDGPDMLAAEGLPVRFQGFRLLVDGKWRNETDRGLGHGEMFAYSPAAPRK